MELFKCNVCGYTYTDVEQKIKVCTKCGADESHLIKLNEEELNKVISSDRTNDIHCEIIKLAMKLDKLTTEGLEIKLDPGCVGVFEKTRDLAWTMKQLSKAELGTHITKGKW